MVLIMRRQESVRGEDTMVIEGVKVLGDLKVVVSLSKAISS